MADFGRFTKAVVESKQKECDMPRSDSSSTTDWRHIHTRNRICRGRESDTAP
jgi:hypothetical protein